MKYRLLIAKLAFNFNLIKVVLLFLALITYAYTIADPISKYLGATGYKRSFVDYPVMVSVISLTLAPIVEELIFRLHLSGQRKHFWSFPIMLLVVLLIFGNTNVLLILSISIVIIIFSIFYRNQIIDWILVKYYSFTFILTSFCFALVHVIVIDSPSFLHRFIIAFTAILPLSIFLGYIRKKYGLICSIASHSFYNLILLSLNTWIYH